MPNPRIPQSGREFSHGKAACQDGNKTTETDQAPKQGQETPLSQPASSRAVRLCMVTWLHANGHMQTEPCAAQHVTRSAISPHGKYSNTQHSWKPESIASIWFCTNCRTGEKARSGFKQSLPMQGSAASCIQPPHNANKMRLSSLAHPNHHHQKPHSKGTMHFIISHATYAKQARTLHWLANPTTQGC